jgi:hypothetical protein
MTKFVLLLLCLVGLGLGVKCTYYDSPECPCESGSANKCHVVIPEGSAEDTCIDSPYHGSASVTCNDDGTWEANWWLLEKDCPSESTDYASWVGNGTECTAPSFFVAGAGNWICECGGFTSALIASLSFSLTIVLSAFLIM